MVTDAASHLGARLVRKLIERGEHVRAFTRAEANLEPFEGLPKHRFDLVFGDARVDHTLYRGMAGCDRVFHIASNDHWSGRPGERVEIAGVGTEQALKISAKKDISKLVVISSANALGSTDSPVEMNEATQMPSNATSESMLAPRKAEEVVASLADDLGLEVVRLLPATMVGPGDYEPSNVGRAIISYLNWDSGFFDVPCAEGGTSIVDVDDVADGAIAAMEKAQGGSRYVLGGENLTYEQLLNLFSEATGLPAAGSKLSPGTASMLASLMGFRSRWTGAEPVWTPALVADYAAKYVWVSSANAERDLGYKARPAIQAISRAVQWYLEHGHVGAVQARKLRIDVRAVA